MALSEQYQQQIINTIKELPEEKLAVVVDFVTSLKGGISTLCRTKI